MFQDDCQHERREEGHDGDTGRRKGEKLNFVFGEISSEAETFAYNKTTSFFAQI